MKSDIKEYIRNNRSRLYGTLKELCAIPAPSHLEEKRAAVNKRAKLARTLSLMASLTVAIIVA